MAAELLRTRHGAARRELRPGDEPADRGEPR
jgi:hypothetical protein